jgi:hypothetical protein
MSSQRRQLQILGALGVVFALVIWWQLADDPSGGGVGRALGRGAAPRGPGAGGVADVAMVELRLADLEADSARYTPGRDPFQFGAEPRPEPRPRREPPPPPPVPVEVKELPPQPVRPRPPALNLRYLGSFGPTSRLIAAFTDGREIFNALAGDVLQGRFIVDKIGLESADIKFVGFPDEPAQRLAAGG